MRLKEIYVYTCVSQSNKHMIQDQYSYDLDKETYNVRTTFFVSRNIIRYDNVFAPRVSFTILLLFSDNKSKE